MATHTGQILVFDMENIPPTPSFQTTPSNSTHCYTFSTPLPTSQIGSSRAWTQSPLLHPKRKKTAQPFSDVLPATLNTDEPPAKKRKYRPRKSMPEKLSSRLCKRLIGRWAPSCISPSRRRTEMGRISNALHNITRTYYLFPFHDS